jgi:uncharacterized protein YggE
MKGQLRNLVMAVIGVVAIVAMLVGGALYVPARTAHAQDATATPAAEMEATAEPAAESSAAESSAAAPAQQPVEPTPVPVSLQAGQAVPSTITVVGEGKVRVEPDIARINIGVEVVRPTVREATDANNEIIDGVIAALTAAGVAEDDIQTSGFSVFAERFGPNGPLPEDQVTYRVTNTVNVIVRNLESVGEVLDASIEAGANNIYGVEFALDDTSAAQAEARRDAIADAQEKAQDLASLTGTSLGRVVSVSEIVGAQPFFNQFASAAQGLGGGGGPAIQPGQVALTMQLQVVYEMADGAQ